jgi:hypothetical protein
MRIKTVFYFCIMLLLLSCSSSPTPINSEILQIPELIEHYDAILKEAQIWSLDAYLYKVYIPIGQQSWELIASFYSTTITDQSLQILLDSSGVLKTQRFKELGVIEKDPILPTQWSVGSRDALTMLMSENENAIQSLNNVCGSLVLVHASSLSGRPLVWILNYNECAIPLKNTQSFLDPLTGKVMQP